MHFYFNPKIERKKTLKPKMFSKTLFFYVKFNLTKKAKKKFARVLGIGRDFFSPLFALLLFYFYCEITIKIVQIFGNFKSFIINEMIKEYLLKFDVFKSKIFKLC